MIDLDAAFKRRHEEMCKFERIAHPLHSRPDVCAFLMLDRLVPGAGRKMVAAAEHDEIFLDVDCDQLADVATDEDILMLRRCGVRYERGTHSLAMFV